jgi:hypothetical protein
MLPGCIDEHSDKHTPRLIFLYVFCCNGLKLSWKSAAVLTYFGHNLYVCIFNYTKFCFGYGKILTPENVYEKLYWLNVCVLLDKTSALRIGLVLVFSRVRITNCTSGSLVSTTGIRPVTPNCSDLRYNLYHVLFLWVKRSWSFRELLPCRHGEVCQHYQHVTVKGPWIRDSL